MLLVRPLKVAPHVVHLEVNLEVNPGVTVGIWPGEGRGVWKKQDGFYQVAIAARMKTYIL